MLSASNIEQTLRKLKPVLSNKFEVERIGYFGSFARGDQNADSDIDILVEFRQPLGWAFFDLQELLEKELQRKVDLVSSKALKEHLREEILRQIRYV
ncbi:nucleotidyltransferase family protein [Bacteroidota bacterium]